MSKTLFELERAYDRSDLAALFRELADSLEAGTTVELHTDEQQLSVDVPSRVVAEIEAEREDEDPPVSGLEFELEWDDADGSSIRVTDSATLEGTESDAADESTAERDESPDDPATGAMSPDTGSGDTTSTTEGDQTETTAHGGGRQSRFEVYQDRANEWRWRLVHWNGNIIADGGEGYTSRSNAERAARGVIRNAPAARIEHR